MATKSFDRFLSELESLRREEVDSSEDLARWEQRAGEMLRDLRLGDYSISGLPQIVFHYLIDADIRLKDERYRAIQEGEIDDFLARARSR